MLALPQQVCNLIKQIQGESDIAALLIASKKTLFGFSHNLALYLAVSHSLYLHAEQLQQRREDAHVVEQKDVVSGPVEHVHLRVTLIKHSWGKDSTQEVCC